MAKNLFRASEVTFSKERVHISPPDLMVRQQHALHKEALSREVETYNGPKVEDLRREAELFQSQWEEEKQRLIDRAKEQAAKIIQEAENHAFEEVKKKTDSALKAKLEAEDEARGIVEKARIESQEILEKAEVEAENIKVVAMKESKNLGFDQGNSSGKEEVERIIDRVHVVLTKAIERRNEIIQESEGQLVQLVLQIAKKVVKVLSENQKNIVINNVVQALRKLKSKADVTIRVNLTDLKITTEHTKELIEKFERVNSITVMEDATVDPGGCIIETDFGQIDARISSQLREIEEKILELTPISTKNKPVSGTGL